MSIDVSDHLDIRKLTLPGYVIPTLSISDVKANSVNTSLYDLPSIDIDPSNYLGNFDPAEVLGKALSLDANYRTNPVELGFPESNCPPVIFAQADGAVNVEFTEEPELIDSKVRLSFPMMPVDVPSSLVSGSDAVSAGLKYWGIPNGVDSYGEMHVQVSSTVPGTPTTILSFNSTDEPLMLRDAPYLLGDSLIVEIPFTALPTELVQPGYSLTFNSLGLWCTAGRKTVVTDHGAPSASGTTESNQILLCADPGFVVLECIGQSLTTNTEEAALPEVYLEWNRPAGGVVQVQRRSLAEENPQWITVSNEHITTLMDASFVDVIDGQPCETYEYRLEMYVCEELGITYSSTVLVTMQGETSSPWDEGIGEHVVVKRST